MDVEADNHEIPIDLLCMITDLFISMQKFI